VFSRTLKKSEWDNTDLASGEIVDEVNALKNEQGGDIICYGGSEFVSSLIKNDLIDEYNLFINPVAIGEGMSIFNGLSDKKDFILEESKVFPCGIVLIKYRNAT
jgi:dihydrofolate reductase